MFDLTIIMVKHYNLFKVQNETRRSVIGTTDLVATYDYSRGDRCSHYSL